MIINLPRGLRVDINNIPDDFDDMICKCFEEFTKGTNKDYRYQDKLYFIDRCVALMHRESESENEVKNLILEQTEWQLNEYGDLPDKDDFWCLEFMSECYEKGKENTSMYSHKYYSETEYIKCGDKRLNDKIMKLLEQIIKVVINYEDKEEIL